MALDGFVRCSCIRDGKAKPHPLPDRLTFDETGEPTLAGDPSEEEWEAHDQWLSQSCEHEGFLASLFLGNITRVKNLRDFLKGLQGKPGPRFTVLLEDVLYDGTHSGDFIDVNKTPRLLKEVETVLQSREILSDSEKEFFDNMKELCDASLKTGNPIMF